MANELYEVRKCPECGNLMWNGICESKYCKYHWYPFDEENEEDDNE